jgi:threonine dehydrogenase-like Zn-dependent dehydrogenase
MIAGIALTYRRAFKVGDRVAAMSTAPCHECPACLAGRPEYCRNGQLLGRHIPGGFAEYVALPAEILVKLPPSVDDNEGASIQPASGIMISLGKGMQALSIAIMAMTPGHWMCW